MMVLALSAGLLMIKSCATPGSQVDEKEVFAHIDSLMNLQETAWNEADLEGFMQSYWKSDSLCFIGSSGLRRGWTTTLSNYQKSYPDAAAMGRLKFENLRHELLNEEACTVIGKWTLYRTNDTLSGNYSLIWQIKENQWKITSDHSS